MKCSEIMKAEPKCIAPSATVQSAARIMREANIGFLPVCDEDGRPLGAITDRDIVLRIVAEGHPPQTTVREVMSREVVSCASSDDVKLAERMMARHHKSRMIVTDGDGKLSGVISLSDVVERDEPFRAARTAKEVVQRDVPS